MNNELTKNEKSVLYGLVKFPKMTDKQLSKKLNIKHSTITSIRNRLKKNDYYRKLIIPRLQKLGCQIIAAIYTTFNPLIPLNERINITDKTIEIFEEIFLSVGEHDKGFSLSISKDYSTLGKINDVRTRTFGERGLLEEEYPNIVLFPFEISRMYRFFDYGPLLKKEFEIKIDKLNNPENLLDLYSEKAKILSDTGKNVFSSIISFPEMSDSDIGRELGVSRHTVSILRRNFEKDKLIRYLNLPNLKKLGFEIMTFYHIKFDPSNPPNLKNDDAFILLTDSTVFFVTRMFEAVMISIYKNFEDYRLDLLNIMQILKENKWIVKDPIIKTYGLNSLIFIKDFKFAPITHKIVGSDTWIKKLLNM
jgi:DNA-binding MarR family transcriptional regulator